MNPWRRIRPLCHSFRKTIEQNRPEGLEGDLEMGGGGAELQ